MIEPFSIRGEWPISYRFGFFVAIPSDAEIQNGFDYLVSLTTSLLRLGFLTLILGGSGLVASKMTFVNGKPRPLRWRF